MQADSTTDRVRVALAEAARMVAGLPENLQTAAFNKAFDALIGGGLNAPAAASPGPRTRARRSRHEGPSVAAEKSVPDLSLLTKSKHPEIGTGRKAIDYALLVLRAARDDCKVNWLTPAQTKAVLRTTFMVKVSTAAVRMALWENGKYVDRKDLASAGKKYAYCLLAEGDAYLDRLLSAEREKQRQITAPTPSGWKGTL